MKGFFIFNKKIYVMNKTNFIFFYFLFSLLYADFNFNTKITQTSNIQQLFPDLVVDEYGNIHAVWVEQIGNSKNIFYSNSIDNGLTFNEKIRVNTVDGSVVAFGGAGPRIGYYNNKIYIIWSDSRNGYNNTSIYLNFSIDNGLSWMNDFEVSDQFYFQLYGDMDIDAFGVMHLIYYNYLSNLNFSDMRYAKFYLDEMILEESIQVGVTNDSAEPCDCCTPDIDVTPEGDVYVAYRNNSNNIRDHYITSKMASQDEFITAIPIAQLNDNINFCPSSSPSIFIKQDKIGASGMYYNGQGIFLTLGESENLNFQNLIYLEPNTSINNYPKIVLCNEFLHVIWIDATNNEVLYSKLDLSTNLLEDSQNLIITDENITQVSEPKIVMYDDNLYVIWTDNRNGINNVYYSSNKPLDILLGDINRDELVNIVDILMVINHIIGVQYFSSQQFLAADINNNNVVNILDIIQIINIILGN